MNNKNENNKAIQNLFEAFSESILGDKEELKSFLREDGIDPDALAKKGLDAVRKMQARAKIVVSKQQIIAKVEMAKSMIKQLAPSLTNDHKALLAKILYGENEAKLAVNFNKLSELNDSDIIDMLDEAKLLEFIENLNDGQK